MAKEYSAPSRELRDLIVSQLARAGADANTQIAGSLWILSVLASARPKTPVKVAEQIAAIKESLQNAYKEFNELPEPDKEWLRKDVEGHIESALNTTRFLLVSRPGGQRETAHKEFIESLSRFFADNGLPITTNQNSPLEEIFRACTGMTVKSSAKTLQKFLPARS